MLDSLAEDARPYNSIEVQLEDVNLDWEVRRIRIETWRVIYAIDEELQQVAILAIRKRPPYDYEDLPNLLANLE